MARELPKGLRTFFLVVVGEEWPTGDKASMRALAEIWDAAVAAELVAAESSSAKAAGSGEGLYGSGGLGHLGQQSEGIHRTGIFPERILP